MASPNIAVRSMCGFAFCGRRACLLCGKGACALAHMHTRHMYYSFTPYYMRLGPHTVLTFILLEQMNTGYYRKKGIEYKSAL
jgi:hypothetical protein